MSRKTRVLRKRFAVFCEGDTEYNYIDKMRKNQGVELVLKPINMHGGGYSNFLQKIKTESQSNYLAKFIIMDADRIATVLYTPALCHRLDTGTSGLVIIAKTPEAEELFLSAIKNREVQKTYLCVTFGRPMPPDATLGGYLLKDADRGIVKIVEDKQPGAKEVETRYETIAVSGRLALLKVQLITGRTHQIRAHMASIGCPILGDSKYGNNSANRELKLKYQALCAWELTMPRFTQPDFAFLSGKTFHAPKPWYYQQVLDGTLK